MGDIALRARALLGSTTGSQSGRAAHESSVARTGPPDQRDAAAIATQLRRAAAAGTVDPAAADGAHLDAIAASLVEQARAAVNSLEAGASAGAGIRRWGHVRMFSPWKFNVDNEAVAILERHGWVMPEGDTYLVQAAPAIPR